MQMPTNVQIRTMAMKETIGLNLISPRKGSLKRVHKLKSCKNNQSSQMHCTDHKICSHFIPA